jgi:hypothetical protein
MAEKIVTVVNNYTHIQTFPVGGKLGTRLVPGANKIRESVWLAIVNWVKTRARGSDASMLDSMIKGPEIAEDVVPAKTSSELLEEDRKRAADEAEKAAAAVRKYTKSSKGKKPAADDGSFEIG